MATAVVATAVVVEVKEVIGDSEIKERRKELYIEQTLSVNDLCDMH